MKEQFEIPKVYISHKRMEPVTGSFGDYPIFDIQEKDKTLQNLHDRYIEFQEICFGPFMDLQKLKDSRTYSIDDFMVQYKPGENHATIWDHNVFTNKPKQINWLDRTDRPKAVVFKPVTSLKIIPKEGKLRPIDENPLFKTVNGIGFDEHDYVTQNRFFELDPSLNNHFDLGVLFKLHHETYELILINTFGNSFQKCMISGTSLVSSPVQQDTKKLTKEFEQIKERRDTYFKSLYGRQL